ncbi:MAG: MinD/ParA family protein [Phycisphaerae bacterium]|nr:MinD/ParA family protein [Phycisphaerae bacterium]
MHPAESESIPHDQASKLRQLMRYSSPGRRATRLVSIMSGKGGVGKTNIAVNLAIAMAARQRRVLLLDMDVGLANADVLLGVDVRWNWSHVIRGERQIRDVIVPTPGGVDLLAGGSAMTGLTDLSEFERHRLLRDVESLCNAYDLMVLDCGAGISRGVVSFGLAADIVVVVATPEPTSLTDAYAMIKILSRQEADRTLALVVNQAASRSEAEFVFDRVAGVAARFLGVPLVNLGYVLQDEAVGLAVRQRRPLLLGQPRSAAAACVLAVARRLAREHEPPEAEPGFLRRVANLFL